MQSGSLAPHVCVCVCVCTQHLWYFLIVLNCIKFYINLNCLSFFYLPLICLFLRFSLRLFTFITQHDMRSVIVHGVRKLSSIYKTSFVNKFLINDERRLKPPARYSEQWPSQHMSRSKLLGLGPYSVYLPYLHLVCKIDIYYLSCAPIIIPYWLLFANF